MTKSRFHRHARRHPCADSEPVGSLHVDPDPVPNTGTDHVEYVGASAPFPPSASGSRLAPYRYTVPSVAVTFQYAWSLVLFDPPVVPYSNWTRDPSSSCRRHFEVSASSRTSAPARPPPPIV